MWTGAFMYGPLVMATTGINNWDEATINVKPDLSDVTLNGAKQGKGYDANLYTMEWNGRMFFPDYASDEHTTHYFRMNVPADPAAISALGSAAANIDRSQLYELLLIAKKRSDEQKAWNAMTVKVPEYAPWAKHGFARLLEQTVKAQTVLNAAEGEYSQEEIDKTAGQLNAVINNMRPGNLAELEDMQELMQLLDKTKKQPDYRSNAATAEAVDFAGMVIRYVSNGSGTLDMIDRAERQLKETNKEQLSFNR
jgi:hypothetical protein